MAWDDDKRAKAVEMYLEAEPTPENSVDILNEIAEELGESPNGVRMILSKAEVYVKKTPATKSSSSTAKSSSTGGTRISKDEAHAALAAAIEAQGHEPDMEIISKLTGKAAMYLVSTYAAAE